MHNDESIITPRLRANSDGSMTDWAICIVGGEISMRHAAELKKKGKTGKVFCKTIKKAKRVVQ